MLNIDEICAVTDKAREFAAGCDRTNCGCQVPQVLWVIDSTTALCDEVEADRKRIAELEKENADLKQEIRTGRHMCAPIHLDGTGAKAFINAVDLSKSNRENAVLKRALEMACEKYAELLGDCPEAAGCEATWPECNPTQCGNCSTEECWNKYYIQRAKEEMEAHHAG